MYFSRSVDPDTAEAIKNAQRNSAQMATYISLIIGTISLASIPVIGIISDRYGRKKAFLITSVGILLEVVGNGKGSATLHASMTKLCTLIILFNFRPYNPSELAALDVLSLGYRASNLWSWISESLHTGLFLS